MIMNRREALTTLASSVLGITGTGLGLTAPASAADSATNTDPLHPDQPIRLALIGARNMGGRTHLPTLVNDPGCRLVAICDVDREVRADAVAQASRLYAARGIQASIPSHGDFREVIADASIHAVVIATPDHWHVPIAKAAVQAGKDVYVEKPLSLYVTEGRELVELVRNRDAVVQVGTQHRSSERFFLASAIVQSGMLGAIRHTEVAISTRHGENVPFVPQPVPDELDYNMWVGPVQWSDYHSQRVHYNFRFVPEFSGGEIANWGAHFLDSAQQALGLDQHGPVRVSGTGERHPIGSIHSSYFNISVDFDYADGASLTFRSTQADQAMGITFHGEKASLFVNRDTLQIDRPELMRSLPKEQAQALRKTGGSHMQNWLTCIRSRKKTDLHAPLEPAHRSAILCHLSNTAIELGRPLQWDSGRESFVNDAHANALLNRPVREPWSGIG